MRRVHWLSGCRRAVVVGLQLLALWLLSRMAAALAELLPLPVPAGAIGLGLLFVLLASGLLRARWIEAGADLLVRHLGLFLIPYAVSFMAFGEQLHAAAIPLAVTVIAATAVGMAASACSAQASARRSSAVRARRGQVPS